MTTHTHSVTAQLSDPTLERELLGCIMNSSVSDLPVLERDLITAPSELMSEPAHSDLWLLMKDAVARGIVPTATYVRAERPDLDPKFLANVAAAGESVAQPAVHVEQLRSLASLRNVQQSLSWGLAAIRDGADAESVKALISSEMEKGTFGISRPRHVSELGSTSRYFHALTTGKIKSISTGFPDLDARIAGGMQLGSYVLFGAATNVGKSQFAISTALSALRAGEGVVYVSGEMKMSAGGEDAAHLIKIALSCRVAGVPPRMISSGARMSDATAQKLDAADDWLNAQKLEIHDSDMSTDTIASIARRMKRNGSTLMIIDNFNHTSLAGARTDDWSVRNRISEQLAEIAHQNAIVLLVLVQTKIDASMERPARLDELSDSKGVSRPADLVLTAWRPVREATENYERNNDPTTIGLISVAKRRSGKGGEVEVLWREDRSEWMPRNGATPAPVSLPTPKSKKLSSDSTDMRTLVAEMGL